MFLDFTMAYIRKTGFPSPIVFEESDGLDLVVPSSSFSVDDVRAHVGSNRKVHA